MNPLSVVESIPYRIHEQVAALLGRPGIGASGTLASQALHRFVRQSIQRRGLQPLSHSHVGNRTGRQLFYSNQTFVSLILDSVSEFSLLYSVADLSIAR
jgi:hypothetical protein